MRHSNARLTVHARRLLVRRVLERRWPAVRAAEAMGVSRATAYKWLRRYRLEGPDGLIDRRPCARRRPHALALKVVRRICAARRSYRHGPHRLSYALGIPRSTIYGVLRREGLHRLDWIDRPSRTVLRYERERPGELVHIDVKKLGRIPEGGGKRFFPGFDGTHFTSPPGRPVSNSRLGYDYLHIALDDHSRIAYLEPLADEGQESASGFLERMHSHFASLEVRVERVLTDNASAYRSRMFAKTAQKLDIKLKRTRAYRPQTNGKVERFNRTLMEEWAYDRPYMSNGERLATLQPWVAGYNQRRPHTALGGKAPISRLCKQR